MSSRVQRARRNRCYNFIFNLLLEIVRVAKSDGESEGVIFQKCCATHQILNEWQNCVELPKYLHGRNAVAKTLIENICNERAHLQPSSEWPAGSVCSRNFQPSLIKFTHNPEDLNCPKRARIELNVLDIFPENQTFLVQRPSSSSEAELAALDISSTGCLDLALLPDGEVEGPFVQGQ